MVILRVRSIQCMDKVVHWKHLKRVCHVLPDFVQDTVVSLDELRSTSKF